MTHHCKGVSDAAEILQQRQLILELPLSIATAMIGGPSTLARIEQEVATLENQFEADCRCQRCGLKLGRRR